jgi:hypothetical protein
MKTDHPTKEEIRLWLAQRRGTPAPPPELCEIRRALWPHVPAVAATNPALKPSSEAM